MNEDKGENLEVSEKETSTDRKDEEIKLPEPEELGLREDIDSKINELVGDKSESVLADQEEETSQETYNEALLRKAKELGWKEQDDYKGDKAKWRDAKEFLDRGDMFERFSESNKEVKQLKKMVYQVLQKIDGQQNQTTNDRLNILLQQKREAITAGNVEEAEAYEKQYYNLAQSNQSNDAQNPDENMAVQDFVERNNSWYNKNNKELFTFTNNIEDMLAHKYPEMDVNSRLRQVEKIVKNSDAYNASFTPPSNDYVEQPERAAAITQRSTSISTNRNKKVPSLSDVPESDRPHIVRMAEATGMPIEEYIKEYLKINK